MNSALINLPFTLTKLYVCFSDRKEMLEKKKVKNHHNHGTAQINCGARIEKSKSITALDVFENEYPYKIKNTSTGELSWTT